MRPSFRLPFALMILLVHAAWVYGPREAVPGVVGLLLALFALSLMWSLAGVILWLLSRRKREAPAQDKGRPILVDGSNVMHWDDDAGPSLVVLGRALTSLRDSGYRPIVYFDANVGYKIENRHLGEAELARRLRMAPAQIVLSPGGTPADPLLLDHAVRDGLQVVTNDRFRDWREQFPALADRSMLIGGSHAGGKVTLRGLGQGPRRRQA